MTLVHYIAWNQETYSDSAMINLRKVYDKKDFKNVSYIKSNGTK